VAMSFDTTSSNSGRKKGAAVLLEKLLGRNLLYLACRHHILELVVSNVFTTLFGKSTGPQVALFQDLKKKWPKINKLNFKPILDNRLSDPEISDLRKNAVELYKAKLQDTKESCPRGDYKELLELSLIALGEKSSRLISFKAPGALHNARFEFFC